MTNLNKSKSSSTKVSIDPKDLEIQTLKDKLARALADYQNLEARTARDSGALVKFANANLLFRLLEIRDHLGMAAEAGDKTLGMILSTFDKILSNESVTPIPTSGVFDPNTMECEETEAGAKNQIIKTTRRGYMLHDRVLRPARVTVGDGSIESRSTQD